MNFDKQNLIFTLWINVNYKTFTKINQIITLFNEKDNQELIQKTLNDLKNNEAEISKETLSHYGKGMTQSKGNNQSSIRIFNYKDTYRLKFSYDSNLNLEKFI